METFSFTVKTSERTQLIDITGDISDIIGKYLRQERHREYADGICVVYCPHTTTGIIINESYDPAVAEDISHFLNKLVPENMGFRHTEGNSDAHVKSSIIGNSRIVPVSGGRLLLGRWEGVFLCEFDGPRNRNVNIIMIFS